MNAEKNGKIGKQVRINAGKKEQEEKRFGVYTFISLCFFTKLLNMMVDAHLCYSILLFSFACFLYILAIKFSTFREYMCTYRQNPYISVAWRRMPLLRTISSNSSPHLLHFIPCRDWWRCRRQNVSLLASLSYTNLNLLPHLTFHSVVALCEIRKFQYSVYEQNAKRPSLS